MKKGDKVRSPRYTGVIHDVIDTGDVKVLMILRDDKVQGKGVEVDGYGKAWVTFGLEGKIDDGCPGDDLLEIIKERSGTSNSEEKRVAVDDAIKNLKEMKYTVEVIDVSLSKGLAESILETLEALKKIEKGKRPDVSIVIERGNDEFDGKSIYARVFYKEDIPWLRIRINKVFRERFDSIREAQNDSECVLVF